MEKITPLEIPLLNEEISQHLTSRDLAHCVLVSKTWATSFTPALWRYVDCRGSLLSIDTLTRQWEYVRGVHNVDMKHWGPILEQLPCVNLRRLEFINNTHGNNTHGYEAEMEIQLDQLRVFHVLETTSRLQHLQITLVLDHNVCQHWIRALEALPHLESLSLTTARYEDNKTFWKILELCVGYKRLTLDIPRGPQTSRRDEATEGKSDMQLRDFTFCTPKAYCEENYLQPLLRRYRYPMMEKLDINGVMCESTMKELSKAFKEKRFPELRHLVLRGSCSVRTWFLAGMLRCINGGLKSLEFHYNNPHEPVLRTLVQYHKSLTRLELGTAEIMLLRLSELMVGLPNLRSFSAAVDFEEEDVSKDAPLDQHWECVELRCLRLELVLYRLDPVVESTELASRKRGLDYVFSEVTRLEGLQELKIEWPEKHLCPKEHEYLTKLADRKQIRFVEIIDSSDDYD